MTWIYYASIEGLKTQILDDQLNLCLLIHKNTEINNDSLQDKKTILKYQQRQLPLIKK